MLRFTPTQRNRIVAHAATTIALLVSLGIWLAYARQMFRPSTTSFDAWIWISAFFVLLALFVLLAVVGVMGRRAEIATVMFVSSVTFLAGDRAMVRFNRGVKTILEASIAQVASSPKPASAPMGEPVFTSPKPPATQN